MIIIKSMVKRGFVCYASVFRCISGVCSIKSTERRHVVIVYTCSGLSVFVIIPCEYLLYCSGCLFILSISTVIMFHQVRVLLSCFG
jgi:hypothetical protein